MEKQRELKMNPIKAYAKDYFDRLDFKRWLDHGDNHFEFIFTKIHLNKTNWKDYKKTEAYIKFKKQYKQKYILALGIRVDEIDRINPKRKELGIIYPLAQSEYKPMTKKQVNFFWELQPFRLELKGYEGNCLTCYKKSDNKLYQIAKENPEAFEFFDYLENKYGNIGGKVPQKIVESYYSEELGEDVTYSRMEVLPKEEYKNTIFRNFRTAKDILEASKNFNKEIMDDHIETESCEIFSNCGEEY